MHLPNSSYPPAEGYVLGSLIRKKKKKTTNLKHEKNKRTPSREGSKGKTDLMANSSIFLGKTTKGQFCSIPHDCEVFIKDMKFTISLTVPGTQFSEEFSLQPPCSFCSLF